ncbi:MAG: lipopolysaccharide biosynthesis protein [Bacteroidales bacterium]|nr:lipopolysaccharide biosynthesis protein [Bacteroidales bacterium]
MARLLCPDDYGAISMITVFISIGEVFVDSGFNNALIRQKNHSEEDYSTVFYFNLAISLVCYAILFFASPYVASFYKMPILCDVLRIQSVSLIINALLAVQVAKLTVELNFKALAKCNFISSVLSGVVGVCLAYVGYGIWALVTQTLLYSTINFFCVLYVSKWLPKRIFSRASFHKLFSYGSKLLGAQLINKIYYNIAPLAIGKFYTPGELGAYDKGAGLAAFPSDTVNMVMQKVTFPIMAKIQDDNERLMVVYRKYIKILSLIIFFVGILFASLAKPIIEIVLTTKWSAAIVFLQIYTFSSIFNHIDTVNLNLLYVKGRSDLVLKLEFFKKGLALAVLISCIPMGVIAICISRVIYTQINVFFDSYYTGKFFNYGLWKQIKDVGPYLLISLVVCLPGFLLSFTKLNNWLVLICGGIIAPILYYIILHKDPMMKELTSLVSRRH